MDEYSEQNPHEHDAKILTKQETSLETDNVIYRAWFLALLFGLFLFLPPPPTSTSKTASLNPTAKLKLTLTTPHSGLELPSVHRTPKKPPEETSSS